MGVFRLFESPSWYSVYKKATSDTISISFFFELSEPFLKMSFTPVDVAVIENFDVWVTVEDPIFHCFSLISYEDVEWVVFAAPDVRPIVNGKPLTFLEVSF